MPRVSSLRSRIVVAALLIPLVSLVVVALRTWRAERGYAAAAQQVVHDYASIAAWQFARRANTALHDRAMNALRHDSSDHQSALEADAVLALLSRTAPRILPDVRYAFAIDFRRGTLRLSRGATSGDSAVVAERLAGLGTPRHGDDPHRALLH